MTDIRKSAERSKARSLSSAIPRIRAHSSGENSEIHQAKALSMVDGKDAELDNPIGDDRRMVIKLKRWRRNYIGDRDYESTG